MNSVFKCDGGLDLGRSIQGEVSNSTGAKPSEVFEQDFNSFSDIILSKNISMLQCTSWDTYMDVEEGVEIPPSLLTGPWTEEMIKYLFWMVKSGARLEWLTSTSGEVRSISAPLTFNYTYQCSLLNWVSKPQSPRGIYV